MDYKPLLLFVLIASIGVCSAYHRYRNYNHQHHHIDHEYDYTEDERTPEKPDTFSYDEEPDTFKNDEPLIQEDLSVQDEPDIYSTPNLNVGGEIPAIKPRYEVTEDVIDIPNPLEVKPIVTNFTIARPLNLATLNNTNFATDKKAPASGNGDEYTHEDMYNFEDLFPGIKDSFDGIKTSFVNGVKKIGNEVINVPLTYLNKIHRKATDVVRKVHILFDHHGHDDYDEFEQF